MSLRSNSETLDLSVKNPNKAEQSALRDPQKIIEEMAALDVESAEILDTFEGCCEGRVVTQAPRRPVRN